MGRFAIMFPQNNKNNFTLLKAYSHGPPLILRPYTLGLMAAFKITIHQIRRSPRKQVVQRFFLVQNLALLVNLKMTCVTCAKCFFFLFIKKNCHKSRVKKSCWPHLNCLFLEVVRKVVGFFLKT
jgi:hypothetical protein